MGPFYMGGYGIKNFEATCTYHRFVSYDSVSVLSDLRCEMCQIPNSLSLFHSYDSSFGGYVRRVSEQFLFVNKLTLNLMSLFISTISLPTLSPPGTHATNAPRASDYLT